MAAKKTMYEVLNISKRPSASTPQKTPPPKFDEKDIKKSFSELLKAYKGIQSELNSMRKETHGLIAQVKKVENSLPNKVTLLNEITKIIDDSRRKGRTEFKGSIGEFLEPHKLKRAISDITKIKDDQIIELNNQIKNYKKEKVKIDQLTALSKKHQDNYNEQKEKNEESETLIQNLKTEKEKLNTELNNYKISQDDLQKKYKILYEELSDSKTDSIIVSKLLDLFDTLDNIKKLKQDISTSSGELFDNLFEQKIAVLIGRLIVQNKLTPDSGYNALINEANRHLETYEIIAPRVSESDVEIDTEFECTVDNETNVSGYFINKYITLAVQNKNMKSTIIKALVDAS